MAKRPSKASEMMIQSKGQTGQVFNGTMFGRGALEDVQIQDAEYNYMVVSTENILQETAPDYPHILYNSIKGGHVIQPVILTYDYKIKEKGGRAHKEKTGFYHIVDGRKRVAVSSRLAEEYEEENDAITAQRYRMIPALVMPLNSTQEEIDKIRKIAAENRGGAAENILDDITKTQDQKVTYCYLYENALIPTDELVERNSNDFAFTQAEIDGLEKSIYALGLLQPIIVYPVMDMRTMKVQYQIEAGHKRTKAIRQLLLHAKQKTYTFDDGTVLDKELVKRQFSTVPALIIPMGADIEHVEKIYNDSNVHSRHMTATDMFDHIELNFPELPTRPITKKEFVDFKSQNYRIRALAGMMEEQLQKLGFKDWKKTKATNFLDVYYYGSDTAIALYKDDTRHISQKDIHRIVVRYKDFSERKKQDEIFDRLKEDPDYINEVLERKTPNKKQITMGNVNRTLIQKRNDIDKLIHAIVDENDIEDGEIDKARKAIKEMQRSLERLSKKIETVENRHNELKSEFIEK